MDSPISGLTTRVVDPMPTTPTPPPAAPGPVSSGYNDNPFAPLDITANRDRPFVHGYRSTNRPADLSDAGDSSDRTRQQPPSARSFVPMPSGRLSGRPQRPSNMFIDTSMRPTSSTGSPISSSPGLSRLPRRSYGSDRHDSARESQASSKESDLFSRERVRRSVRAIDEARRPAEDESRQQVQEEERRQAQLEQDRYAARDQARAENAASYREQDRLAARERARAQDAADRRERDRQADREARRNASRERHRQASQERHRRDAAAALEAEQDEERQRRVDAEYEQMRRERAAADARNREDQRIEQLRRDAEALRLDDERRARDPRPRRVTGDSYISPSSPRFQPAPWPPRRTPPYGSVAVHQGPSSRRSNPLRERGQGVIAEERGRAAGERMSGPYQRTSTEMYDDVDDYYADEGYIDDRRRRRDARDAYRDSKHSAFWS